MWQVSMLAWDDIASRMVRWITKHLEILHSIYGLIQNDLYLSHLFIYFILYLNICQIATNRNIKKLVRRFTRFKYVQSYE